METAKQIIDIIGGFFTAVIVIAVLYSLARIIKDEIINKDK